MDIFLMRIAGLCLLILSNGFLKSAKASDIKEVLPLKPHFGSYV
jgi:hypothetical protein